MVITLTSDSHLSEEIKPVQMFKAIFDNATDGIMLADVETKRFRMANRIMCKMLGYSEKEILKLGVADIHPEDELQHVIDLFERQAKQEFTLARSIPVKRKDGSLFYADVNSGPIAADGKTYLLGIFRDITERKQAEDALKNSEKRFRSAIENAPDFILFIKPDGTIIDVNHVAEEKGFSKEIVVGTNVFSGQYYGGANQIEIAKKRIMQVLETKKSMMYENSQVSPDGSVSYYETRAAPFEYDEKGNVTSIELLIRDITDRRKAEEKIRKQLAYQLALFRISKGAKTGTDSDDFIGLALGEIGKAMDAGDVSFFMREKSQNKAIMTHSWSNGTPLKNKKKTINLAHFGDSMDQLIQSGVLKIPDDRQDLSEKFRNALDLSGVRSLLGVPLYFKNSPVGYLGIQDMREREWDEPDITFLQSASQVLGIYLENRIIQDNLNQRMQLENLVSKIALKFMSKEPFAKKMDFMLSSLGSTLEASRTYVYAQSGDGKYWSAVRAWFSRGAELPAGKLPQVRTEDFEQIIKKFENKEIITLRNLAGPKGNDKLNNVLGSVGSKGGFAVPIHAGGRLWGCLAFAASEKTESWKEEDIVLLLTLAGMVGWLVEKEKPKT